MGRLLVVKLAPVPEYATGVLQRLEPLSVHELVLKPPSGVVGNAKLTI